MKNKLINFLSVIFIHRLAFLSSRRMEYKPSSARSKNINSNEFVDVVCSAFGWRGMLTNGKRINVTNENDVRFSNRLLHSLQMRKWEANSKAKKKQSIANACCGTRMSEYFGIRAHEVATIHGIQTRGKCEQFKLEQRKRRSQTVNTKTKQNKKPFFYCCVDGTAGRTRNEKKVHKQSDMRKLQFANKHA